MIGVGGEVQWRHFPELCDGRPELRVEPQFWSEDNPLRIKTDVDERYVPDLAVRGWSSRSG